MPLPDPVNGNLAISNIGVNCEGPGDITINVNTASEPAPWGRARYYDGSIYIDPDAEGGSLLIHSRPACWDCTYWPLGDADGDGYVTAGDVVPIINFFGQPASASVCTDLDSDGYITAGDVVPIINNFGGGDGVPCP